MSTYWHAREEGILIMKCPLCGSEMTPHEREGELICQQNNLHILKAGEAQRFAEGEVNLVYLRHRMKVRRGKMVER